jgi:hypothetical protein
VLECLPYRAGFTPQRLLQWASSTVCDESAQLPPQDPRTGRVQDRPAQLAVEVHA